MDFTVNYLQEPAREETAEDANARGFYNPRVKVYRLNNDGKWVDKGTGHVSVEYLERLDAVGLVVIDEEDQNTLLVHRISADDIYQRQEETIISWTDPEVATDLALSFQETMGCNYIWEQVCSVQRQIQFPTVGLAEGPRQLSEELEHSGTSQEEDHFQEPAVNDSVELPRPELGNLPQLAKIVADVSPFHRERMASVITRDPTYLKRLLDLFRFSEDLENTEGLHLMYRIVKGIIMLNDNSIFEIILRDDCIMEIVGALEYDPDAPKKAEHRQYLKEQATFKEAIPIRDPTTLSKIHQTYRIGYIKDVILPSALDDQTFGSLNSLMLFNHVEVISSLQNDRTFLGELFAALRARQDSDRGWQDCVYFLQEFCSLSRHLQPQQRNHLYQSLLLAGLFEISSRILESSEEKIRLAGADILMCTLTHDPAALRNFLAGPKGRSLFAQLMKGMLTPSEGGLQAQLLEMMRMLLDSDSMEATEKSLFLDLFYDDFIEQLVATLVAGCKSGKEAEDVVTKHVVGRPMGSKVALPVKLPVEESLITAETLNHICELLTFCVQHHSFRIKYYVLRNNVVEKVLRLTRRREKYLVVAAIRFLRTCIGLKDDFYARYLVKNNLFAPVVEAFKANGDKYNMLNSAVLEMVDYVRKENMKALVCHLWETFGDLFSHVTYVDTFQNLHIKYNQVLDGAGSSPTPAGDVGNRAGGPMPGLARDGDHGSRNLREDSPTGRAAALAAAREMQLRRRRDGSMDQDEEAYFNSDGDDEDESEQHLNARIDQLRGGHPAIEGPPLPQPTANGGEQNLMGMRNPFGLVDYEDEDEESPPGSSGGNGVTPHSRREGHQQPGPHLWQGGSQARTGIWGDGMALKRGPLTREGALGFPNGSNFEQGPLRVARRVSPGRDHAPRRRELDPSMERDEYEDKMKRRRMMGGKANGEGGAPEDVRRNAKERGWKSTRSKWREHLLKRDRAVLDGMQPGLQAMEEDGARALHEGGERGLGAAIEPQAVLIGAGQAGTDAHAGEGLQADDVVRAETAHDILMGVDLPSVDAFDACDTGADPFAMQEQSASDLDGPSTAAAGLDVDRGLLSVPREEARNQQASGLHGQDGGGRVDGPQLAATGPDETGSVEAAVQSDWQGSMEFQHEFPSTNKEADSTKSKLESDRAPNQDLLGIGGELARSNPTPEPYEVR